MFTGRGLIGAVSGLLILLIVILCLAETRQRFGGSEWGIFWLSRWGNVHFTSLWFVLRS